MKKIKISLLFLVIFYSCKPNYKEAVLEIKKYTESEEVLIKEQGRSVVINLKNSKITSESEQKLSAPIVAMMFKKEGLVNNKAILDVNYRFEVFFDKNSYSVKLSDVTRAENAISIIEKLKKGETSKYTNGNKLELLKGSIIDVGGVEVLDGDSLNLYVFVTKNSLTKLCKVNYLNGNIKTINLIN